MSQYVRPSVLTGQAVLERPKVSLYQSDPLDVVVNDDVGELFKKAGITNLEFQGFLSPADSQVTDPAMSREQQRRILIPRFDVCRRYGFRAHVCMDGTYKQSHEAKWMRECPWAKDAIQGSINFIAESGLVDTLQMVDESKMPSEYPGVEDTVQWMRDAGAPPIYWPTTYHGAWNANHLSDGSFDEWAAWIHTGYLSFPYQMGSIINSLAAQRRDKPSGVMLWYCSYLYYKAVEGDNYQDGKDRLFNAGVRARQLRAQLWIGLGEGASIFRTYGGYDWALWRNLRRDSKPGSPTLQQTGATPGTNRWEWLEIAFQGLEHRVPFVGPHYKSTRSPNGVWYFGRRGNLVWGVNTTNQNQISPKNDGLIGPFGVRFWEV